MSAPQFITISSVTSTGVLGSLPRIPVLVTRETVAGYTADPVTGLIKINSTDLATFTTNNPTSYGLINALTVAFGQNYFYQYVYILMAISGVTQAQLTQANITPRAWSFLTLVDRYNGGGTGNSGTVNYFADLATIQAWGPAQYQKIFIGTFSTEESGGVITLPAPLLLGGTIGSDAAFKIIVSNSQRQVATNGSSPVYAYNNIALAWASYCINGAAISRSWGSLSDAHDFNVVSSDSYTIASRNIIANAALAQYNGAKDRAGSLFVYDTQMNSAVNPPLTDQIEALLAGYYINDYVYVYVHNALQAAGQTGVTNDNPGIQTILGLVRAALNDCYKLNLILSNADGSPAFSVAALTPAQVTALSPNWTTTGIWPSGVISASVKRFSAAHYITINFAFA